MKRNVPIALALILGLVMMTTYYFPWMDPIYQFVLQWTPVIAATAFFLGILSFVMHHSTKIKRKIPGHGYSIAALVAFAVMALSGILSKIPFMAKVLGDIDLGPQESVFQWLFTYMLVPMEATMFALLAFYIASASFRAFRARNIEATLLLIAAVLIMIGRVPLGEAMWGGFTEIQQWIMEFPNTAAKRAIMIGVGLGMASTALKLMLGIERAYLGRGK